MTVAVLIDPYTKTVSLTTVDLSNTNTALSNAAKAIGCEWVQIVRVGGDAVLLVDEEGLLKTGQRFFRADRRMLAGKALLVNLTNAGTEAECFFDASAVDLTVAILAFTFPPQSEVRAYSDAGGFDGSFTEFNPDGSVKEVIPIPLRPNIQGE